MRFKKSLKKPYDIAEYIRDTLIEKFGFNEQEIYWDMSGLSDSQYLTIDNWEEMTKKSSPYNDESLIIRISNHDLPPSYDGLHGYYDYDLKSDSDTRWGTNGDAMPYYEFLEDVQSLVPLKKQDRVQLQEWMIRYDEIYDWYKQNNIPLFNFPFFDLKYLSKSERLKKFKNLLIQYPNDTNILESTILSYGKEEIKYYNKMIKDLF